MAKKPVAKSSAVEKNIATAMDKLAAACKDGDKAVKARGKEAKKLLGLVKRLSKRRAALVKRKRTATKRAKKTPNGENRKALRTVVRDLARTSKELTKARATKAAATAELAAVKTAARQAGAYARAIAKADRALKRKKR